MSASGPMIVDDALVLWCADPFPAPVGADTTETALRDACAEIAAFIGARCTAVGEPDPGLAAEIAQVVLERAARLPSAPAHPKGYLAQATRDALVRRGRGIRTAVDAAVHDLLVDPGDLDPFATESDDEGSSGRLLAEWLERFLVEADSRLPGAASRMRTSLDLLSAGGVDGTGRPTVSALRAARRHRQVIEDAMYEELRRAHAYSRSAPARVAGCPSRETAIQAPTGLLLEWRGSLAPGDDLRELIELWVCFIAFRRRFRAPSPPSSLP